MLLNVLVFNMRLTMVRGKNAPLKIGRNDKVLISCGTDSKTIKYKKAIPLLENGWALVKP